MTVLRRWVACTGALVLGLVLSGCDVPDPNLDPAVGPVELVDQAPSPSTAGIVKKPVTCAYSDGTGDLTTTIDVYEPPPGIPSPSYSPVGTRPVIVYVHGGGWSGGDTSGFDLPIWYGGRPVKEMVQKGWVVAAATYRLAPAHVWPAQIVDAKAAVNCARNLTGATGITSTIDTSRVVVSGGSAGGHLATLIGLTAGTWEPGVVSAPGAPSTGAAALGGTEVDAAVNFDGPTDLRFLWQHDQLALSLQPPVAPLLAKLFCGADALDPDCVGTVANAIGSGTTPPDGLSPSPIDWIPTDPGAAVELPRFYLACGSTIDPPAPGSTTLTGGLGPSFVECADTHAFARALANAYPVPAQAPVGYDDTTYAAPIRDTDGDGDQEPGCLPPDVLYARSGTPWCAVNHLVVERRVNFASLSLFLAA